MLDRYTTGLQPMPTKHGFYIITLALRHAPLFLEGFSDAVAFLADWILEIILPSHQNHRLDGFILYRV
jgi:hypothetical protein